MQDDTIYFKDAGELIGVKANVKDVMFFDDLSKDKVMYILKTYGKEICTETLEYTPYYDKKKYCILIFLQDIQEIKPFDFDKSGFGNGCAWITVKDIYDIKK